MRFPFVRALVHFGSWLPLVWLTRGYLTGHLTANPIQAITQRTGQYALTFLMFSLACTPLFTLFGFRQALQVRRTLGLYAFLYAAIHFLVFTGLDYRFDWVLLSAEILKRRFILVGLGALIILLLLALTSHRWWMKRLGKNWKRLQRLVYLAGGLVIVHYAWAKKGDLLRLQGDIIQPLIYGIVLVILLVLRVPVVRDGINTLGVRQFFFRIFPIHGATNEKIHTAGK